MSTSVTDISLVPHPDTPPAAIAAIDCSIHRTAGGIWQIDYGVSGGVGALRLPVAATPARVDGLWQRTCFELFLRCADEPGYAELNFSPSGEWAAYRFEDYRAGMVDLEVAAPQIDLIRDDRYRLRATLDAPVRGEPLQAGVSAVIEETDGTKSYWALRHPPGKPDFHHPDCFALQLP